MEQIAQRLAVGIAMTNFYAFVLVLVRMSGLMVIGPIFGQRIVPANVRVLLVVSMAFVVTPTLSAQSQSGFNQLDLNRDGLLSREETPDPLKRRYDGLIERLGKQPADGLRADEFEFNVLRLKLPSTVLDFAWAAAGEFALGLVLGVGVLTILSGLQLAGEMIDQQTGMSLGQLSNPGMEIQSSVSGQFLFLFGMTVLVIMGPVNGHLMMVASLLETFRTLPVGEAYVTASTVELLQVLMQQSLVLAIKVAAPMLACMSLVALTMGFLGHSVPQLNILVIGFPVRASVALLILALTITGTAELIVTAVPQVIDTLRQNLSGLE